MDKGAELTAATFGWVMAMVLPGLLGIYTISYWSSTVADQLAAFSESESTFGLFFIVLLTCLIIGLELSAIRWVIFERLLCRQHNERLRNADFGFLANAEKRTAFKEVVYEHYRYHQFFGGVFVVLPFFFWGLICSQDSMNGLFLAVLAIVLELVTYVGAVDTYQKYVERTIRIIEKRGTP